MALHIRIHPDNPQPKLIKQVAECLQDGGIIVYPTDTIYGLGCSILNPKAIGRIARIKQIDPAKAQLSFICADLSDLSKYAKQVDTPSFRILKQYLPGPYTFILNASKEVPKLLQSKKSTIGLRIPDHKIAHALLAELSHPILSASLPGDNVEDYTDPEIIIEKFDKLVDMVVDGGLGGVVPSTIVNLTGQTPELLRMGKGPWDE